MQEPIPRRLRPLHMPARLVVTAWLAVSLAVAGCQVDNDPDLTSAASPSPAVGLSVELTVEQIEGERRAFEFTFRVQDDNGGGPGYTLDVDDRRREQLLLAIAACPAPVSPPPPTPAPVDRVLTFRHTYAEAGVYDVRLEVVSRPLCGEAPEERRSLTRAVEVE